MNSFQGHPGVHRAASATTRNPRFFVGIQVLRGIAAMLVVAYHLVDAELVHGRGTQLLDGLARFGFAGVDIFFVISGFVMTTIATGRYASPAAAGQFLLRRAIRILPLYWIYTTVIVAILLLAPHALDAMYRDKSVLASYLLWPQEGRPLLQVGWTLIYEGFFYLMMAGAIAFVPQRAVGGYLLAWAGGLLWLQFIPVTTPWLGVVASPMGWEFIAGALVGCYARRLPGRAGGPLLACGAAAFVAAALVLNGMDLTEQRPLLRTLTFGACSVLIVLGLALREPASARDGRGLFERIGNASYSIYLSHLFVLSAAARAWSASGMNTTVSEHVVFLLATLVASILVGWVSYRFIERPLLTLSSAYLTRRQRAAASLAAP